MKSPDPRGWLVIGLFALVVGIMGAIVYEPSLEKNELFGNLAVAIVSGSFCGGAVAFYFNTSKSSADKDDVVSAAVNKIADGSK